MAIKKVCVLVLFVAACGSDVEKENEVIDLDRGGWAFSDPAPVRDDEPDPIDPFDPTDIVPATSCDDAMQLPDRTSVALADDLESVESICGGEFPVTYFTFEIPPRHRLQTQGIRHVAPSCDTCDAVGENYLNEDQERSRDVVLEAVGDETGLVRADLHEIPNHADCREPLNIDVDGNSLQGNGLVGGGQFNGCGLIDPGNSTLYYSVDIQLGGSPVEVIAIADDGSNLTLSIQVISPYNGACETEGVASCIGFDDAYFRSSDTASVVIGAEHGGGRDPARAIVAITTYSSIPNSSYTIQANTIDSF